MDIGIRIGSGNTARFVEVEDSERDNDGGNANKGEGSKLEGNNEGRSNEGNMDKVLRTPE